VIAHLGCNLTRAWCGIQASAMWCLHPGLGGKGSPAAGEERVWLISGPGAQGAAQC